MAAEDNNSGEPLWVKNSTAMSLTVAERTNWTEGAECLTLDFSPQRDPINKWKRLSDCAEFVGARRSKHTMVAYRESVYVFGGDNGKQMLNDLIRYDPADDSWSRAFTTGTWPAPRYHHSAVVYDSSMFVFGGYTGDIHSNLNLTNKNDLFEYKFASGQWTELKCEGKLPPARSAHGAVVFDGKMWVFGGFDGHTRLNDLWSLSLLGPLGKRCWTEVEQTGDCPPPCCNFALVALNDNLYLFSGQSGAKSSNCLFQFNFATSVWTKISKEHILRGASPAPVRRYGHTMTAHGNHLYVFGGAADNIHTSDLHSYDLQSHRWKNCRPVKPQNYPTGRLFHTAVVIGDSMYVFGGTVDNNVRSSELYKFHFATEPRCTLHDDFGKLLESRQFCDVKFLVGQDRTPICAHIAIVAARSVYLRGKIKQNRDKSTTKQLDVWLPEAEPVTFETVLDYMYTDQIDPTKRGLEPTSNGVILLMMDVYRLSLNFSMKRLENLCIQYLESMIGLSNVIEALQYASNLNLLFVKEYCLKFITREANFSHIVNTKEFETMNQPLMVEIIRRRQLKPIRSQPESNLAAVCEGQTLADDLKNFVESGVGQEFSDLTLVCGDEAVPVHKVILAARSAYFEAMFRSFMPDTDRIPVGLGQVIPSVQSFKTLLKYIYYGHTEMPPEDALYLFSAPYFYQFTNNRLQIFCKLNLETQIRWDNVLDVLDAADKICANEMKRHALRLIVADFVKVSRLPKLKLLSKDLLLAIIQAVADGSASPTLSPMPINFV